MLSLRFLICFVTLGKSLILHLRFFPFTYLVQKINSGFFFFNDHRKFQTYVEVDRGLLTPHAPIIQFQQLSTHGQSYVLIFHTHYPQPWVTLKQTHFTISGRISKADKNAFWLVQPPYHYHT